MQLWNPGCGPDTKSVSMTPGRNVLLNRRKLFPSRPQTIHMGLVRQVNGITCTLLSYYNCHCPIRSFRCISSGSNNPGFIGMWKYIPRPKSIQGQSHLPRVPWAWLLFPAPRELFLHKWYVFPFLCKRQKKDASFYESSRRNNLSEVPWCV